VSPEAAVLLSPQSQPRGIALREPLPPHERKRREESEAGNPAAARNGRTSPGERRDPRVPLELVGADVGVVGRPPADVRHAGVVVAGVAFDIELGREIAVGAVDARRAAP
jgi:hypothetical protein